MFTEICRFGSKKNIDRAKELLDHETSLVKAENIEDGIKTWVKQDTVWTEIMQKMPEKMA
jgi:hypothetical protein